MAKQELVAAGLDQVLVRVREMPHPGGVGLHPHGAIVARMREQTGDLAVQGVDPRDLLDERWIGPQRPQRPRPAADRLASEVDHGRGRIAAGQAEGHGDRRPHRPDRSTQGAPPRRGPEVGSGPEVHGLARRVGSGGQCQAGDAVAPAGRPQRGEHATQRVPHDPQRRGSRDLVRHRIEIGEVQRAVGVVFRLVGSAEPGEIRHDESVGRREAVDQALPVAPGAAEAVDPEHRGRAGVFDPAFPHLHPAPGAFEAPSPQSSWIHRSDADGHGARGGPVSRRNLARPLGGAVTTKAHRATLPWHADPEGKDEAVTDADVIVMGMGPGGEEVAGRCADGGLRVLAVEKKLVGGECPYWGCVPSKVMVRAADSLAEAARAVGLAGSLSIEPAWEKVATRLRGFTADWNDEAAVERHEAKGTKVIRGKGRLQGPRAVEVEGVTYEAARGVVIATGGEPAIPPIDGLADVELWTNRDAIETTEVPGRLVVLGGGAIGLELAQVFQRFGSNVTVVESAPRVLALEEPENGEALGRALADDGISLRLGVRAERVSSTGGGVRAELSDGTAVDGDRLLVATGRRSDFSQLGLDTVGLDPTARSVEADDHMRAAEGLWAVGDVTGRGGFTHVATYQGRIAAADILGVPHAPADYSAVPRVTFTDPEVASVGLTEQQATEAGIRVAVGVSDTSYSTRGSIHGPGAERGVIKLVADEERGVLVGGSIMSPAAGEILGIVMLAVRASVPIQTLKDLIYPYPTFVRGLESSLADL